MNNESIKQLNDNQNLTVLSLCPIPFVPSVLILMLPIFWFLGSSTEWRIAIISFLAYWVALYLVHTLCFKSTLCLVRVVTATSKTGQEG